MESNGLIHCRCQEMDDLYVHAEVIAERGLDGVVDLRNCHDVTVWGDCRIRDPAARVPEVRAEPYGRPL